MGIYYALAAYQENRAFFYLTVPMRLLTFDGVLEARWSVEDGWVVGGWRGGADCCCVDGWVIVVAVLRR